jgi:hypothetical protein
VTGIAVAALAQASTPVSWSLAGEWGADRGVGEAFCCRKNCGGPKAPVMPAYLQAFTGILSQIRHQVLKLLPRSPAARVSGAQEAPEFTNG